MSHTPEPWIVNGSIRIESEHDHGVVNDGWIIGDLDGPDAKENARRIVACVNACEGILTETIEGAPKAISKYIQQGAEPSDRDTYRELCLQLCEDLRYIKMTVTSPLDAYYIACEAVKKAESILGDKS